MKAAFPNEPTVGITEKGIAMSIVSEPAIAKEIIGLIRESGYAIEEVGVIKDEKTVLTILDIDAFDEAVAVLGFQPIPAQVEEAVAEVVEEPAVAEPVKEEVTEQAPTVEAVPEVTATPVAQAPQAPTQRISDRPSEQSAKEQSPRERWLGRLFVMNGRR